MDAKMADVGKMQESQNFVLKDLHDKRLEMNKRLQELERTDFEDKFNHITRRMIADVLRELLTPIQMLQNIEVKSIKKLVEEHVIQMEAYRDAIRQFRSELDDYRLKNHYDLNNGKKEADGYMKELVRMQKLDHIRTQVTARQSISNNPHFNKTVDFATASLRQFDNDSMTQDSLFISQENVRGAPNTVRAHLSGTPGYMDHNSSAFRTVNRDEVILNQSSVQDTRQESSCPRVHKPSQRNKVIMTRSVDHNNMEGRDFLGAQAHNSIFGVNRAVAKMNINNNTTLELVDPSVPKFKPKNKQLSPFVMKKQRQQFVEERSVRIGKEVLHNYKIDQNGSQMLERLKDKSDKTPKQSRKESISRFETSEKGKHTES